MPKVSVIVPIYGVEKFLREALDSVLVQTLSDIEIILIDDGSKDSCPQIIDEYAEKDSRIIAIHKENGGYGSACNVGLSRATGDYVAILEPDDYIDSKMYEDLYNISKKYDSDIVNSCFYEYIDTEKESIIYRADWLDYIPENKSFQISEFPYFLYYHPSIWTCIYKKEFIDKYNIHFVEAPGAGWTDNLFQVQTMCLAKKINYTSKSYYYWRRLTLNSVDDIKDYRVPIQRCNEIHDWIIEKNITDERILAKLYARELVYIDMLLQIKQIPNQKLYLQELKNLCKRIDKNVIFNNKDVPIRLQKILKAVLLNPMNIRKKIQKNVNKNCFFRFHLRKNSVIIVLFGKTLFRKEDNE